MNRAKLRPRSDLITWPAASTHGCVDVKLHQIYAEEFQGRSDLVVDLRDSSLNAVRMPDQDTAEQIFDEILDSIFGVGQLPAGTSVLCSIEETSFILAGREPSGNAFTYDDFGDRIQVRQMERRVDAIDFDLFQAIFTDRLELEEFQDAFDELDLITLLAKPAREPVVMKRVKKKSVPAKRIDFQPLTAAIEETHAKLKATAVAKPSSVIGSFVEIKLSQAKSNSHLADAKQQLATLESQLTAATVADNLAELWHQRENLHRDSDSSTLDATIEVRDRILKIDADIKRVRRAIRKTQKKTEGLGQKKKRHSSRRPNQVKEALAALATIEDLRGRIQDFAVVAPETSKRSSRATLEHLRPFAREVRNRREALRRVRFAVTSSSSSEAVTPLAAADSSLDDFLEESPVVEFSRLESARSEQSSESLIDESPTDLERIAITDLRYQADELKAECAKMLTGRALAPSLLMVIALVFATGLALVAAGLFLHLGNGKWLSIFAGLTAMIGSGVLKYSCERPSGEKLHYYRQQIAALLHEIAEHNLDANLPGEDDPGDGMEFAAQRITHLQNDLEAAKQDWHNALFDLGLPAEWTPRQLLSRFKQPRRSRFEDRFVTADGASLDDLRTQLQDRVRWLSDWRTATIRNLALDESVDWSIEELVSHLRKPAPLQEVEVEVDEVSDVESFQDKLRKLKKTRQRILANAEVASLAELQEAIAEGEDESQVEAKREQLNERISTALSASGCATEVRNLLKDRSPEELALQRKELEAQVTSTNREIVDSLEKLKQLGRQLSDLTCDRTSMIRAIEIEMLKERARQLAESLAVQLLLQEIVKNEPEVEVEVEAAEELGNSPTLNLATKYLRSTTPWRDASLELRGNEIIATRGDGRARPWTELPEQIAEQASICIRLAIANELRTQELGLPLLLRGSWTAPQRRFARSTGRLLAGLARQGQQVCLVLDSKEASNVFHEIGEPVQVVELEQELVEVPVESYDDAIPSDTMSRKDEHELPYGDGQHDPFASTYRARAR